MDKKIKSLIKRKLVFIIGSGYSQIIGPLVPYKLNNYNYRIGNEVYKNFKCKTWNFINQWTPFQIFSRYNKK